MNMLSDYGFIEFSVANNPNEIKFFAHFYANQEGFGVAINTFHKNNNIGRVLFKIPLTKYIQLSVAETTKEQVIKSAIALFEADGWAEKTSSLSSQELIEFTALL